MAILGTILLVALAAWGFFNPALAAWVFISIYIAVLEGWSVRQLLRLRDVTVPADKPPFFFTEEESELTAKYALHFAHPFATREASSLVAGTGLAVVIWVPLLVYHGLYLQAAIIGLNYFVTGPLSHLLSPLKGLRMLAVKGDPTSIRLLDAWDTAWEKIIKARSPDIGSHEQDSSSSTSRERGL